jgi:hypothetical protein
VRRNVLYETGTVAHRATQKAAHYYKEPILMKTIHIPHWLKLYNLIDSVICLQDCMDSPCNTHIIM